MTTTYKINDSVLYDTISTSSTLGTVTISAGAGSNGTFSTITNGAYVTGYNNYSNSVMSVPYGENKVIVEEKAELEVKGRVKINGEYLDERLERIETLLNIPVRDVAMEEKYPKLKELWEAYNRELAKYKTWDALK